MQAKLPVLACTDPNTDIGKVIVDGGFGWWCESNDAERVKELVERALTSINDDRTINEWAYLKEYYSSQKSYEIITAAIR